MLWGLSPSLLGDGGRKTWPAPDQLDRDHPSLDSLFVGLTLRSRKNQRPHVPSQSVSRNGMQELEEQGLQPKPQASWKVDLLGGGAQGQRISLGPGLPSSRTRAQALRE